jgi:hypothetical protein
MAQRGGVQLAQGGDRELAWGEREPEVRVGQLRAQPVAGRGDDRGVVEGRVLERCLRQRRERVPCGVRGHRGIGVGRDEAEEGRGDPADAGHAVGPAEHRDLLDVGDVADVDLLGELAQHRALDVLVVAEQAAGQCPAAGVRWQRASPCEYLQ